MGVISSGCYGAGESLVTGVEDSWRHLIQGPLIQPSIQRQAVELGHLVTTDAVLKNKDQSLKEHDYNRAFYSTDNLTTHFAWMVSSSTLMHCCKARRQELTKSWNSPSPKLNEPEEINWALWYLTMSACHWNIMHHEYSVYMYALLHIHRNCSISVCVCVCASA